MSDQYLKKENERLRKENGELKSENHILKERLENYIPRRRVRRVYKMIEKILTQDGIDYDLDRNWNDKDIEDLNMK